MLRTEWRGCMKRTWHWDVVTVTDSSCDRRAYDDGFGRIPRHAIDADAVTVCSTSWPLCGIGSLLGYTIVAAVVVVCAGMNVDMVEAPAKSSAAAVKSWAYVSREA